MNRIKLVKKNSVNVFAKIFNFEHYRKFDFQIVIF
jgi:hypothetical protein